MNKKIVFSFAIVLFSLSLVACNKKSDTNINGDMKDATQKNADIKNVEIKDGETSANLKDEKSKLASMMERGEKIKCEYLVQNEGEEVKSTVYIDGEKFRTEVNMKGLEAVGIFDGEAYYNWTKGEVSQGSKMTKRCMEETEAMMGDDMDEEMDNMSFENIDDIVEQEADLKMNCVKINKIDFDLPSDIKFVDTCEMMKSMKGEMNNMEDMQKQMEQMQEKMER